MTRSNCCAERSAECAFIVMVSLWLNLNVFTKIFGTLTSRQTHHVDSTLKRRENGRFHVVSTWNPRDY